MNYRKEIDGLRAIAVIAVILDHLGLDTFSGGYIGVDMFFVVSGFVIFRGILANIEDNRFSIRDFYRRRVNRIIPALVVMIGFTLLGGLILLTPQGYEEMSESALAALFSLSNFYFDNNAGNYFAATSNHIPLLHTWSLGVEEQFYLLVPLIYFTCRKNLDTKRILIVLIVVIFVTFGYNLYASYVVGKLNHAFYFPISRLWEIAIGGVLALFERRLTEISQRTQTLLAILGLTGILASVLMFHGDQIFPGWPALLPVLSTALLIVATPVEGTFHYRLLANRGSAFIGKISYSLYLYHWPIIVYFGLYINRDFRLPDYLFVLTATLVMATLSWLFVEQPFRQRNECSPRFANPKTLVVPLLVVIIGGASGMLFSGFPGRMKPQALEVMGSLQKSDAQRLPCVNLEKFKDVRKAGICTPYPEQEDIDYILWGDSHAGMMQNQISIGLQSHGRFGIFFGMPDCQPLFGTYTDKKKNRAECKVLSEKILNVIEENSVSTVILASRWANLASAERSPADGKPSKKLYDSENNGVPIDLFRALERTVSRINSRGAKVVIVGPVPEIEFDVPKSMVRAINLGQGLPRVTRSAFDARQPLVLEAMKMIELMPKVSVIYPHFRLCDANECRVAVNNQPLYRDDDHLSEEGVKLIVSPILQAVLEN